MGPGSGRLGAKSLRADALPEPDTARSSPHADHSRFLETRPRDPASPLAAGPRSQHPRPSQVARGAGASGKGRARSTSGKAARAEEELRLRTASEGSDWTPQPRALIGRVGEAEESRAQRRVWGRVQIRVWRRQGP